MSSFTRRVERDLAQIAEQATPLRAESVTRFGFAIFANFEIPLRG